MVGESSQPKTVKNQVQEDVNFKAYVNNEENARKLWKSKWGWILDEYDEMRKKLRAKLQDLTHSRSEEHVKKQEFDTRTILPFPDTTNRQYGWICTIPEFVLEKYGPDVDHGLPLPKEMHLVK